MFNLTGLYQRLPAVQAPLQKLNLANKLKWTLIILVIYFILGSITVWGINPNAVSQFEFLEIVFGSRFGSLITLGIGPIVTASIILQLLVGSKLINWDLSKAEDKAKFTGSQKILGILFAFIEAIAYVLAGAVPPVNYGIFTVTMVIMQLALGGIIVIFMDEVVSKWGIGSGISLFIAAGVSKTIFVRIFSPPIQEASGGIIASLIAGLTQGQPATALISLLPLVATFVVFAIVVFAQAIRVDIPMAFSLPFGKFAARRWPLKFLYTSNIPVILTAAVVANIQVVGRLLYSRGLTFLGTYDQTGNPISGLAFFFSAPSSGGGSIGLIIMSVIAGVLALAIALFAIRIWKKHVLLFSILGAAMGLFLGYAIINFYGLPQVSAANFLHAIIYMLVFVIGSTIFSIFWVSTAGMDSHSVAEQFRTAGIVIPGFRQDPRIIERVLDRYIPPLTILGGAFVGFLASYADLTGALGTGTGILLTVMIIYQFYEQITLQHYDDIPDSVKKVLGV